MSPDRLPHGRSVSAFEAAWAEFRRYASGPIGCILALLCLPFALLALLVMVGVALWKGRKLRQMIQGQLDAERGAGRAFDGGGPGGAAGAAGPGSSGVDALAVAQFVRMFAADISFTREEATRSAVPAASGRTAEELLDQAIRQGWVEESRGRLVVTERGRNEAETILRSRGM